MDYLQSVVYRALCRNPQLDEEYARGFATTRIKAPIDLHKLDFENRDLVAAELGCTPDEMDAYMMVTKALWNGGKCEHTAAENRALAAAMMKMTGGGNGER